MWVSVVAFFNFAFANFIIFYLLRNKRETAHTVLTIIAWFIFLYKVIYYTYFQIKGAGFTKFPVEFSAVMYFVLSIAVIFRIKSLYKFAAFGSILAGLIYNITFIATPYSFISQSIPFEVTFATINHTLLYISGMIIVLYTTKFKFREIWQLFLGTGMLVGYTYLAKYTFMKDLNMATVLLEITEGTIIKRVAPNLFAKPWFLSLYYIGLVSIYFGLMYLLYLVNAKANKESQVNHKGTVQLSTDRLTLRRFSEKDAEDMFVWANDEEVTRYLPWSTHNSIMECKRVIKAWEQEYTSKYFYNWAIELDGKAIGSIGMITIDADKGVLKAGYVISRKYWGKGIVPEALGRVIKFAFEEVNASEVFAEYHEANLKSERVMQKVGMQLVGKIAWGAKDNQGRVIDVMRYNIVNK